MTSANAMTAVLFCRFLVGLFFQLQHPSNLWADSLQFLTGSSWLMDLLSLQALAEHETFSEAEIRDKRPTAMMQSYAVLLRRAR
jgi:hypothetical protein